MKINQRVVLTEDSVMNCGLTLPAGLGGRVIDVGVVNPDLSAVRFDGFGETFWIDDRKLSLVIDTWSSIRYRWC